MDDSGSTSLAVQAVVRTCYIYTSVWLVRPMYVHSAAILVLFIGGDSHTIASLIMIAQRTA